MNRRLVWHPMAVRDLEEITAFITDSSPQNGDRFRLRSLSTFSALKEDPFGFRPLYPDVAALRHVFHGRIIGQPNHLFFFRIDGDVVTVLRVLHGARGDLRERVGDAAD